jgi:anti-sigma B factor antagonist
MWPCRYSESGCPILLDLENSVRLLQQFDLPAGPVSRLLIEPREIDGVTVLRCTGRICYQREAELLATAAEQVFEDGHDLVLDLAGIEIVDSAGIGQLVLIHMRAQAARREVTLASVPNHILQLLKLTNTARLFECVETPEAALCSRPDMM